MLNDTAIPLHQFDQPEETVILQPLRDFPGRRVLVIGDAMLDHYVMGEVNRISPEAPVPVVEFAQESHTLGGAANVAKCAAALGAEVELISIIGNDAFGEELRSIAKELGIQVERLIVDDGRSTTFKTRIVAGSQHMLRIDRECRLPISDILQRRVISNIEQCAKLAEVLILSDYAKGVLSESVCQAAITASVGKPIIVDPKGANWRRYRGAAVIKPNATEAESFSESAIVTPTDAARVAQSIGEDLAIEHVVVTMGEQGAVVVSEAPRRNDASAFYLPSRVREVFDITGAGDVVAATLAVALGGGASISQAAWLANVAAGVSVGRFGAATVSQRDIANALYGGSSHSGHKVMHPHDAARLAANLKAQGKKIVFTNGCFDLLHLGHISLLERSRQAGNALFVGVNTDASARRVKGSGRPIQPESDRAELVAAQGSVDAVVLFDEDTPYHLIKLLQPEVITKGADYKRKEDVIGWDVVEAYGGRVLLLDPIEGRSSTKLIERSGMIASAK